MRFFPYYILCVSMSLFVQYVSSSIVIISFFALAPVYTVQMEKWLQLFCKNVFNYRWNTLYRNWRAFTTDCTEMQDFSTKKNRPHRVGLHMQMHCPQSTKRSAAPFTETTRQVRFSAEFTIPAPHIPVSHLLVCCLRLWGPHTTYFAWNNGFFEINWKTGADWL